MIEETFNNFDDLFLNLNRGIIENPEKYLAYNIADNYFLKPLFITVLKPEAKLDFSFLGYRKDKFYKLLYNYVDLEEWERFKQKLKESRALSLTFYFNKLKKIRGNNLDSSPCILNLVFSRKKRSIKWEEVFVYYRTTEIDKAFYLDLFLFQKLLEDVSDVCEIKKVNIINPLAFFKTSRCFFVLNYLNIDLDDSNYLKKFIKKRKNYLENSEYSKFGANRRVQMYLKGKVNYKSIDPEVITLYKEDV